MDKFFLRRFPNEFIRRFLKDELRQNLETVTVITHFFNLMEYFQQYFNNRGCKYFYDILVIMCFILK